MSYRLIDSNALAQTHPEVNDMPCIYADLDKGLDGCHYDLRGANTLQAENVKLRELVEDLYLSLLGEMPESMLESKRSRMRELGIEVDLPACDDLHDIFKELGIEVDG